MSFLLLVIVFLLAAVVAVPLFKRFGLGAVLGYLAAGILIGPSGLGLVGDVEEILHFSELGVVLLLFLIGLELKPARLWVLRRMVFTMGSVQMALTTLLLWPAAAWWLGSWALGLLIAVVLSLSSTAIGLQTLAEKKQLTTHYGRQAFGILLFQDLAVIPLLAIIPLFAPLEVETGNGAGFWLPLIQALAVIAAIVVGGRYLLRPLLRIVARTEVHEVFIGATLLIVLGTAVIAEQVGLSMALGAFLAGVLLADSEYRHEVEVSIEPFKGLLLGLFFISVGMAIDFGRVLAGPVEVLAIVAVLMTVKLIALLVVGRLAGLDSKGLFSLAFALPQAGEFAFVLFSLAVGYQVLPADAVDRLIVAVTISMAMTPLMYFINERFIQPRFEPEEAPDETIEDHGEPKVIIAGFGRVGQIVARNLSMLGIHFTALDNSSHQVDFVSRFGHKIYFGNATHPELLRSAGAEHARVFVLTISDIEISLATARAVRRYFPHLKIFARARNRIHAVELMEIGAHFVMRETFASSLEMSREVLATLGVRDAGKKVDMFRQHDEDVLQRQRVHKDDEAAMVKLALRSREELEQLFSSDREAARDEER